MENDKRILNEVNRSKQIMEYTTIPKKKLIPEVTETEKEKVEEGKIITLSEFVKG